MQKIENKDFLELKTNSLLNIIAKYDETKVTFSFSTQISPEDSVSFSICKLYEIQLLITSLLGLQKTIRNMER